MSRCSRGAQLLRCVSLVAGQFRKMDSAMLRTQGASRRPSSQGLWDVTLLVHVETFGCLIKQLPKEVSRLVAPVAIEDRSDVSAMRRWPVSPTVF